MASREFYFQELASELTAGADVINHLWLNLGAHINVKTAKPLDNSRLHIAGPINAKHSKQEDDTNLDFTGVFSNTFGAILGFSHHESTNRIDVASTSRWATLNANDPNVVTGDVLDINGSVITPEILWYPGHYEFTLDEHQRKHTGINVGLQWSLIIHGKTCSTIPTPNLAVPW